MARLYTDENVPVEIAVALRKRGHNVLTADEAGIANKRIRDPNVLAYATSHKRVVMAA